MLEEVFKRLETSNLVINKEKCTFGIRRIDYLGYRIEQNKITPIWDKAEAIRGWPTPTNKKGVRRFLGAFNQYRRFIPQAANLVRPLQLLLKKKVEFDWGEDQQKSFNQVKEELQKNGGAESSTDWRRVCNLY